MRTDRSAATRTVRRPLVVVALLAVSAAACGSNAPAPGDQLEVDGESPVISDPGGVGNQISNDEITDDDVDYEVITGDD